MSEKQKRRAKNGELDQRDYATLASFRRSLRKFLAFSEEAARKAGLPPRQHQAILAIRGLAPDRGMSVHELAEHLLLKPQTTVELVDRLVDAGLVRRERDEIDRRRVFLSLTAKANRILEKLSAAHLAQTRRDAPQLIELLRDVAQYDAE
ncbi:helix-turn-helix domain-containing protein [Bradyrhizobium sp. ARR65]|uniref:MarR family winged helix-turn-helix transcriptional regulator n=1 Tax=Bradyrhizobium sp. ARR65 TaxID=1040989 RepID=UPI00046550CB|nr:helix-turn-helix domain-containing protein [Bradyrhizobium sp. ARR65]